MASKPILYYCLVRSYSGMGFRVIGVTSEQRGQIYGRDERDYTTHVAEYSVLHRFPPGTTEEFAKGARIRAERAQERFADKVAQASSLYDRARREQRDACLAAAKGETPAPAGRPLSALASDTPSRRSEAL